MSNIDLYGVKSFCENEYGDLKWMCKDYMTFPNFMSYKPALYLFPDNEEEHNTCIEGSSHDKIRYWNKHARTGSLVLSAGIPIGTRKNEYYTKFTPNVKKKIDDAFIEVKEIIKNYGEYKSIYYPCGNENKFDSENCPNPKIANYITSKIHQLSNKPVRIINIFDNTANVDADAEIQFDE